MSSAGDIRGAESSARSDAARAEAVHEDAPRVDVIRGDPTPEELAAVFAVVTEAYQREASDARAEAGPRLSAWQVSARMLRAPLRREIGWGRFGG